MWLQNLQLSGRVSGATNEVNFRQPRPLAARYLSGYPIAYGYHTSFNWVINHQNIILGSRISGPRCRPSLEDRFRRQRSELRAQEQEVREAREGSPPRDGPSMRR